MSYDTKINDLNEKVNQILNNKQQSYIPSFMKFKNINMLHFYIGIPIIFFIIFIITRPNIIMSEVKDPKTFFKTKKISYIKLFLILLLIIGIEVIVYFILNIKTKNLN